MPANLPPQYHEVEKRYRTARSIPEKVAALQEMLAIMPKHKGTDHLRAELRSKMARLLQELERPATIRGGRPDLFSLRKEGAGQAVLVGLPNVGKSQLLASLTGARTKVAPYPFTTQAPVPGMLPFENILIQVVDTPPVVDRDIQARLYTLFRGADVLVLVVDLTEDACRQVTAVLEHLGQWGFRLLRREESPDPSESRTCKPTILVGNKADVPIALDRFQCLERCYGDLYPVVLVSALERVGLEDLGREVFRALDIVRVYTKAPGREPDFNDPLVLPRGSRVEDVAEAVHKEWRRRLKFALLWGSGKFEGQRVGREYVVADGDVVELHG